MRRFDVQVVAIVGVTGTDAVSGMEIDETAGCNGANCLRIGNIVEITADQNWIARSRGVLHPLHQFACLTRSYRGALGMLVAVGQMSNVGVEFDPGSRRI